MEPFVVNFDPLDSEISGLIYFFFEKYPKIYSRECFIHTRSPFDNLGHYIFEELFLEPNHGVLLHKYNNEGKFTALMARIWISQELEEYRRVIDYINLYPPDYNNKIIEMSS
jgi:hypothetical protein